MPTTSQSSYTVPAGTTEIRLIQTTSTSSSECGYSDLLLRWLDNMDELDQARQRQCWFVPRKISTRPPVFLPRIYQKNLQKQRHPFPIGSFISQVHLFIDRIY